MCPKASVVIPCYNHAHYLAFALESVLSQTFADWEAIVVDDGSTDHTRSVAAGFTDPRIHYIYQENQGLSAARNAGLALASGEYLAFLDADDEWAPEFLARCVDILSHEHTLAGICTGFFYIDGQSVLLPGRGGQAISPATFRSQVLQGSPCPIHGALIRAFVLDHVGPFDTALTSAEDWDLWLRISADHPLRGIEEPLARYRVYPGSMSTNADRMHANRLKVLAKHFGSAIGDPATWPAEKRRAYAYAYRRAALLQMESGRWDTGWQLLRQALLTWPGLLGQQETFFGLACIEQPRGYRGRADLLDIRASRDRMLAGLDGLWAQAGSPPHSWRHIAYGNAYLVLAILSDQAGQWIEARRYLYQAVRTNWRLVTSWAVMRRSLKLLMGQTLARHVRWLTAGGLQSSSRLQGQGGK